MALDPLWLQFIEPDEANVYENIPYMLEDHFEAEDSSTESPVSDLQPDDLTRQMNYVCKQVEFHSNSVSGVNECITGQARKLCIFDLALKLIQSDHYDIGGTYTEQNSLKKPDLWFYCTTSLCADNNCILNIFVCHRSIGCLAVGISDGHTINRKRLPGTDCDPYLSLSNKLSWKIFQSWEIDESHHIKSYCFSKNDRKFLNKHTLCIPIEINMNPTSTLNKEVILRIKRNHNLCGLFKQHENTDYTLESTSGKKYDTHKLLLAAHSPVLRGIMQKTTSDSLAINVTDEAMEQLLEYIYTGTVRDIESNCYQLTVMANTYKLEGLLRETECALINTITVNNAIDIAVLSEKYKLDKTQKRVIEFIKVNPKVLETDGWNNLNDVNLTKKLFKEVYVANNTDTN